MAEHRRASTAAGLRVGAIEEFADASRSYRTVDAAGRRRVYVQAGSRSAIAVLEATRAQAGANPFSTVAAGASIAAS